MNNGKLDKMKEEIRGTQITAIKEAVLGTLQSLDVLEKAKQDLHNTIRMLKHDLSDLKDGRLDRIVERQEIDEKAKKNSAISVVKVKDQRPSAPWFVLYELKTKTGKNSTNVNNSITKTHASGSYKLSDGSIKYL